MSSRPKILVTGSGGQLGKELQDLAPSYPQFEFVFLSKEDMPIHNFELVRVFFNSIRPAYCINCAAYTAVDKAESEKELAFQVNGEAVGVLAAVCQEHGTRLVHVSTDYVFNGEATYPYTENFPTDPINVYGASKLEGEKQAIGFNADCIVIRTSWVYSSYGKNFVKTMVRLMDEKDEISVVNDQIGSPTYAADLAEAILKLAEDKWVPGIYNFSNEGMVSWYEFAEAIKHIIKCPCDVKPITTAEYPTPAKRPAYSVLDKTKIQQTFGIQLKDWKESLTTCLEKIQKQRIS
ncbi:MAG TPA: dTDP-4-dehydrorhamnose reductase [Chitinophagaceae bacterium]|nr:dTDP-4-dehydrorhamnose reductase [Chitinophagaceae bacterium]